MPSVTRTEIFTLSELEPGVLSMEEAGWSVRQVEQLANGTTNAKGECRNIVVVFERDPS